MHSFVLCPMFGFCHHFVNTGRMKNWDIDQYITGLLSYATMIKYNDTPYKVSKNSSPTAVAHLRFGVLFLACPCSGLMVYCLQ
jgi:hypothetical protein